MKRRFKLLVDGTELEDCQKQRFHISRSFLSDTCQGNRQNSKCRVETACKARKKKKREVPVSDWTIGRHFSSNQKLLFLFSFFALSKRSHPYIHYSDDSLDKCQTKSFGKYESSASGEEIHILQNSVG